MVADSKITSVRFLKYKALRDFSITLRHFNVLVGPNNSGKSTILGAFRILAEGMRRARARKPEPLRIAGESQQGYRIALSGKDVLSLLNAYLQEKHHISITAKQIIAQFEKSDLAVELVDLVERIDAFRKEPTQ